MNTDQQEWEDFIEKNKNIITVGNVTQEVLNVVKVRQLAAALQRSVGEVTEKWISVDKDSDYDGEYLGLLEVTEECKAVHIRQRVILNRKNKWVLNDNEKLLYWMPLPKAPTGEPVDSDNLMRCRIALQELYNYCKNHKAFKNMMKGEYLIDKAREALAAVTTPIIKPKTSLDKIYESASDEERAAFDKSNIVQSVEGTDAEKEAEYGIECLSQSKPSAVTPSQPTDAAEELYPFREDTENEKWHNFNREQDLQQKAYIAGRKHSSTQGEQELKCNCEITVPSATSDINRTIPTYAADCPVHGMYVEYEDKYKRIEQKWIVPDNKNLPEEGEYIVETVILNTGKPSVTSAWFDGKDSWELLNYSGFANRFPTSKILRYTTLPSPPISKDSKTDGL